MALVYPECSDPARARAECFYQLLEGRVQQGNQTPVLGAPGALPLRTGRLFQHVQAMGDCLHELGIGRNDRVAMVLPNGPEAAAAFLSVAAWATCAPLNPDYRAGEFDFFLSDLKASALIVRSGMASPARDIARARGIALLELTPTPEAGPGLFTLEGEARRRDLRPGPAEPGDVALMLHTSGTTSRPKLVPLTHANLCASARNIEAVLRLNPADRCLNVMPLFHIHGLIGALLSSVVSGGSVHCTPGFNSARMFEWLRESQPTWYTAVPTIHQSVLAGAMAQPDAVPQGVLRLIRSSSAALPPQVMQGLERVFQVPVIEAYGMTEASHQMASNLLPPGQRKAGSVGRPAGPEITILDATGNPMPAGATGEVAIRGDSVTRGYEENPTANREAFCNGWFRTGDQGHFDEDGYLFLSGRLKELINRGGEKISPREIDEVLLDHPAVAQAVAFAAPHPRLGEDVAAAIVLRKEATVTEQELRDFALQRLAAFKVPSRILIVKEIPKGPTGKLQRIGLAAQLQEHFQAEYVAPDSPMEELLARIWGEILGIEGISCNANYFALGGDSLMAVQLFAAVEKATGKKLPPITLFQAPTIQLLAKVLEAHEGTALWSSLVPIQPVGFKPPFFCAHANDGDVFYFRHLAGHFAPDRPFYGLQPVGLDGKQALHTRIEDMAAHYLQEVRRFQPKGPYYLGGFCLGGVIAFEMAQQLHAQGERVPVLALIEASAEVDSRVLTLSSRLRYLSWSFGRKAAIHWQAFRSLSARDKLTYLWREGRRKVRGDSSANGPTSEPTPLLSPLELQNYFIAVGKKYEPSVYPGRVAYFRDRSESGGYFHGPELLWKRLATGGVEVHPVPGEHDIILQEPHVRVLAEELKACLDRAPV